MKSFLNYSKNRILYNIFRGLFLFSMVFLVSKCDVKALETREVPSGENYPEFATYKVHLLQIATYTTAVDLYGYDFPGIEPPLSDFINGTIPLVRYADNTDDNYGGWSIIIPNASYGKGTYLLSWSLSFKESWMSSSFCSRSSTINSMDNGKVNSSYCTSVGTTAILSINYTLSQTVSRVAINFSNVGGGMSANWFLRQSVNVYYPQISISDVFDSSVLEGQNNTIISQNQTIINQGNQTNDKLDGIQDALTDETQPDTSNLGNSAGWLPAGPVDSILNLPLTLFQSLLDNLGSSCAPVVLPIPYVNKNLTLPCFNSIAEQINGFSTWWNGIGVIASAFILYNYLLKLYKWVDDTLTFRENTWQDWGGV